MEFLYLSQKNCSSCKLLVISPWYHKVFWPFKKSIFHTKSGKNVVITRVLGDFTHKIVNMIKKFNFKKFRYPLNA